jgi:serine/threonine-protein kinase
MGVVYLARDVQLDRDVALKVLPSHLTRSDARERFLREARTAAGLSHPHVVPIHRVGEAGGFVFFVMSYVEGETLGERLRTHGPLPPAEAARILREVAWALAYAHGRGIVHRDVKPDNIMLEAGTGRALVTDFGIAYGGSGLGPETEPGRIMGTAHFMSPEQASGEPLDGRSDLYALGVVGYLAVSGRLPFEAPNLPALLVRQATEAPPSVLRAAPALPPALGAAIDRCLARDPADRYADGEALAAALAPKPDARAALPPTLRAWLAARNPLLVPYLGWSAGFGALTLGNVYANATGNPGSSWWDVVLLAGSAAAPLFPIVGFHLYQARRQFRAGHALADLRSALDVARRERAETAALARDEQEVRSHRVLRVATVAAASWLAVMFALVVQGAISEKTTSPIFVLVPLLLTMLLGAVSNALDVQFVPDRLREWWQTGLRERLWNGRAGEWLARRLGAPERSRAADAVFRPTESALGLAAADLFAALAPARGGDADVLAGRRRLASAHLQDSVAALEGIRLDLLRLHGGASDLAPLTTLVDGARLLGEDIGRLSAAAREVDAAVAPRPLGPGLIATPS